ncbi:MAG TPA: hypothetical protein VFG31_10760 [Conexibacter sp.]|nr:hypothetical protein [Conexibacter sp.]
MTSSRAHSDVSFLVCPDCGGALENDRHQGQRATFEHRWLRCSNNARHRFRVQRAVPNLLAPRMSTVIRRVLKDQNGHRAHDTAGATQWLSEALELDLRISSSQRRDRVLRRFLVQISALLEAAQDEDLLDADVKELCAIVSSIAMSAGYRRHVADPAVASLEAVNYEKYEDILLRRVISGCLSRGDEVVLIELGSGPGRLLHQYGSTISTNEQACVTYRRLGPLLYDPSSLPDREGLKLVLGVDFVHDMLQSAASWLRRDKLGDLVQRNVLSQVCATVRDLPVTFDHPEWHGTTRVACILFQTLGNQVGRSLQIDMLRAAKRMVGEHGIVFVSVFNAESFEEQGASYYNSIKGSVGASWHCGDRTFLSKRGVYSKWFYAHELRSLFEEAGMSDAEVLDERALRVFPEYGGYIDVARQEQYKRRALIGFHQPGRGIDLASE